MAEINWGLLDTNAPAKVANSIEEGKQNALARIAAQQGQQMNALQLQKAMRGAASESQISNALAASGGDLSKAMPSIMQVSPKEGLQYQKMIDDQRKAAGEQELVKHKVSISSANAVSGAGDANILQVAQQHAIQNGRAFGVDPSPALQHIQQVYEQGGPAALRAEAQQAAMTIEQKLLKLVQINTGGQTIVAPFNQQTGQMFGGTTFQHTVPPGQSQANDLTERRLNLLETGGGVKVSPGYRQNQDGTLSFIPGGPADPENPLNKSKKETPGKILPAQRLEDLADMKKVRDVLKEAGGIAGKENVSTGPLAGRMQSAGAKVGMASDSFVNLQQKISTAENIMLKLRSGAAVTDQEYARFKNEYPSVNDTKEVRDRKLNNAIEYATNLMNEKISLYEDGGYKVPNLDKPKDGAKSDASKSIKFLGFE